MTLTTPEFKLFPPAEAVQYGLPPREYVVIRANETVPLANVDFVLGNIALRLRSITVFLDTRFLPDGRLLAEVQRDNGPRASFRDYLTYCGNLLCRRSVNIPL